MKRRDEVTVGVLITVAVIVLVIGTLWLVRGGLRSGYPLYTRFAWGQSLRQGQSVLLAGVTIGYVSNVALNPDGFLDVDLRINDEYKVPRTAVAEVMAVGLFGDAAVALRAERPSPDSYASGDTVPTRAAASGIDAITARADSVAAALQRITLALETEFVRPGGIRDLRQALASTNRFVTQMQAIAAEQNRNLTTTLTAFRSTARAVDSAQLASTIAAFRSTAANADSLMQRLSSNTTQLQAILARLERGDGTAGKFLTDSMMYRDTRNLLMRVDSLVADFQRNPRKYINLRIF